MILSLYIREGDLCAELVFRRGLRALSVRVQNWSSRDPVSVREGPIFHALLLGGCLVRIAELFTARLG